MPVQIPLDPSVPDYRMGVALEGVQYLLDVRWNARDAAWYLSILDDEGTMLRAGMKLVLGAIIGLRDASGQLPPGTFIMSDLANTGVDAGLDDITTRVALFYYESTEA